MEMRNIRKVSAAVDEKEFERMLQEGDSLPMVSDEEMNKYLREFVGIAKGGVEFLVWIKKPTEKSPLENHYIHLSRICTLTAFELVVALMERFGDDLKELIVRELMIEALQRRALEESTRGNA